MILRLTGLLCLLAFSARAEPGTISVLAYHRFDAASVRGATTVLTSVFAQQVTWLAANNVTVVPLANVVAVVRVKAPPHAAHEVAITVDDGYRSVYTEMFPVIRRANIAVTLFINPPAIGHGTTYLTWPQIGEMVASGLVTIEAHTQSHPNFNTERAHRAPDAYAAFVRSEIAGSRQALLDHGYQSALLAWPYGIHDTTLEAAAQEAGFSAAFALGSRPAVAGDDRFAIPRYQVYNTDTGPRFAAIVAGMPRGGCCRRPAGE